MKNQFDVIVIGGGHAGIEAAYAAARMGAATLLITPDLDKIAAAPCNPSIGGLGKGHIVYEISALGGLMPKLCSQAYLQARMLNTSKGPAVQGLRLQIDKYQYSKAAKQALLETKNLTLKAGMASKLLTKECGTDKKVSGVTCEDGTEFFAPTVVVTTGTFMRGVIHVGHTRYKAGRRGEPASYGLSESIAQAMGVPLQRLKTGTPPRLARTSIDFSQLEKQPTQHLEYLYEFDPVEVQEKMPCYIALTNARTCQIIRENFSKAALFSGYITGIGPRYCPSIEDKVNRFPDRTVHHVFVEPEGALPGEGFEEIYPAGLSTSLPLDVQESYIRSIPGFENAVITKCGYAIEYDAIQPNNLTTSLETKTVSGLFLAGQLNGTTGYEEAAGQGLIAGINAALKIAGKQPFTLQRHEAYLGVMIDDLITLGVDEPYRMFTSRAERRLLLRQDNVFLRLMPYGKQLGLIDDELYNRFLEEKRVIETCVKIVKGNWNNSELFNALNVVDFDQEKQHRANTLLVQELQKKEISPQKLSSRALLCIHAEIKYAGYMRKEQLEVEKSLRYQELKICPKLDFTKISGLTREMQQKLNLHKPQTIAQAQLIPGMTPAAISILIFQSKRT
ncbi:MAG: tRNA uridine-5-carboxymethylaminomethyl(34) synthesis enzyme MnmG [bacterium]